MSKILFVTPEAAPFAMTCGLSDIIASLPRELRDKEHDVRVIMPKYSVIPDGYTSRMHPVLETTVSVSWRQQFCGVKKLESGGVPFYFIDNEQYFRRDGLYCYPDDAERFVFFCRAVLDILPQIDFIPDIIQCFDWQTGMLNVILKSEHSFNSRYAKIKTIYTIRSLSEQGVFHPDIVGDILGIDWNLFHNGSIEFDGKVNFLKAGIVFADKIMLSGISYAEYLNQTDKNALSGILQSRAKDVVAIMPGINTEMYNPKKDKLIFQNYDVDTFETKKAENKRKLQESFNLPQNSRIPLIAIVSRLTAAKGMDLLSRTVSEIVQKNEVQLVVLGTGDTYYEEMFQNLTAIYPHKIAVTIAFDTEMAHKIYAAADLILMPSHYDAAAISQLIALRYGTIPVLRQSKPSGRTGHIKTKKSSTSITFQNYTAIDFLRAVKQAITLFHRKDWNKMIRNAMNVNSSWKKNAGKIRDIYKEISSEKI